MARLAEQALKLEQAPPHTLLTHLDGLQVNHDVCNCPTLYARPMTAPQHPGAMTLFGELPDELSEENQEPEQHLAPEELSEILLYPLDWSVQSLLERIGDTLDVNPSFQRRDAWDRGRKSRYVESLALGLPVPQIVLAEDRSRKGKFIVLDGKQRLVTLKQFAAPDKQFRSFKLRGLKFLTMLDGLDFTAMKSGADSSDYAEAILAQPIRTIVVRNWVQPAVLYEVFIRLNQNSLPLSPQELRQALFPSAFTTWINQRSSASSPLQLARRAVREDFRMRDAEMLLRYVGWELAIEEYRGNLRQFLDEMCEKGQSLWHDAGEEYFEDLAGKCELAIARTFTIFGDNAFLRYQIGSYNRRFNVAVFDLMTVILSDASITDEEIAKHSAELRTAFEKACDDDAEFRDSITATTKSIGAVKSRFLTFAKIVQDTLEHSLEITSRIEALEPSGA